MGSAAPILGGMALFADSFSKAYNREREAKRLEKDDAFKEEQRNRQRQEWKESDQLKTDLKTANETVAVQEGSNGMVKPDTMDDRDVGLPENAEQPNGGLMVGQFKVGQQAFLDKGTADKVATDANSADGVNSRTAAVYRKHGQIDKAMSMENAVMDQKSKRLGLSAEEMKHADLLTNKSLEKVLQSGPTWYEGAAQFVTNNQLGGLKDIKAKADLSPDGKTVTLKAIMPDGSEKVTGTYDAGEKGMLQFQQKFGALPLETRMTLMRDQIKTDQAQSNFERQMTQADDHFKITKALQEKQIGVSAAHLALARSEESRKQQIFENEAKLPEAVKRSYGALQDQAKAMDAIIYKAQAEGTFKDDDPAAQGLLAKRAIITGQMNKLMNPYIPASPDAKGAPKSDPLGLDGKSGAPAAQASPASVQQPAARQPSNVDTASAPMKSFAEKKAPVTTTDGGKTWQLDIPKTIRDPSVKWYREIPNPAYQAIGEKSFSSADEARAALAKSSGAI